MTQPGARAIYLAPTKALCSERCRDWQIRFKSVGVNVQELTGDTEYSIIAQGPRTAQVVVTTPEKWDSITRTASGHGASSSWATSVRLVLVDEIHMLGDSRGATLEVVISRARIPRYSSNHISTLTSSSESITGQDGIRVLALSATCPNIQDVGAWLNAATFVFDEKYRPVQLDISVLGFDPSGMSTWQFEQSLSKPILGLIRQNAPSKPVLVFCATRKSTEATAKFIVSELSGLTPGTKNHDFVKDVGKSKILQNVVPGIRDSTLRSLLLHGCAFHHAGLEMRDRKSLEQLFIDGHISVLCTTSTLAIGVNLPAFMVIVKGTLSYNHGSAREYSEIDLQQIVGRAGRPQFETEGKACILTESFKVAKHKRLVCGGDPIDSALQKNLPDHLNAEIALGTVFSEESAISWIKNSFYFVRLQKKNGEDNNTEDYTELAQLIKQSIEQLQDYGLIEIRNERIRSTDLGLIMSKYYLSLNSFGSLIQPAHSIPDLLYKICLCDEFSAMYLHSGDKSALNELCRNKLCIRFPLPGKVQLSADKVFLIIQCVLSGISIPVQKNERLRVLLSCETRLIWQHLGRITKALVEILKARQESTETILCAILLQQSVRARCWFDDKTRVLQQLEKVGPVLSNNLKAIGVNSIQDLLSCEPWRIEQAAKRHPPFGASILDAARKFPEIVMGFKINLTFVVVELKLVNAGKYSALKGQGTRHVHLLAFIRSNEESRTPVMMKKIPIFKLKDDAQFQIPLKEGTTNLECISLCEDLVGANVIYRIDVMTGQIKPMESIPLPIEAFYFSSPQGNQVSKGNEEDAGSREISSVGTQMKELHSEGAKGAKGIPQVKLSRPKSAENIKVCGHRCKNKAQCAHGCCKRGIPFENPGKLKSEESTSNKSSLRLKDPSIEELKDLTSIDLTAWSDLEDFEVSQRHRDETTSTPKSIHQDHLNTRSSKFGHGGIDTLSMETMEIMTLDDLYTSHEDMQKIQLNSVGDALLPGNWNSIENMESAVSENAKESSQNSLTPLAGPSYIEEESTKITLATTPPRPIENESDFGSIIDVSGPVEILSHRSSSSPSGEFMTLGSLRSFSQSPNTLYAKNGEVELVPQGSVPNLEYVNFSDESSSITLDTDMRLVKDGSNAQLRSDFQSEMGDNVVHAVENECESREQAPSSVNDDPVNTALVRTLELAPQHSSGREEFEKELQKLKAISSLSSQSGVSQPIFGARGRLYSSLQRTRQNLFK
jgi:replicative superfamily II helicase